MLLPTPLWTWSRTDSGWRRLGGCLAKLSLLVASVLAFSPAAAAAEVEEAQKLFNTGHYDECLRMADEEIGVMGWSEPWRHLKIKSQLATGKYSDAIASVQDAVRRFPASITLRLLGHDVYRLSGRDQEATAELNTIERLVQNGLRRYATEDGFVAVGRYFLLRGIDARKVLDQFYDVVTKQKPEFADALLRHGRARSGKRRLRAGR